MTKDEKNPQIKLSTIVCKRYITVQLLGKGGYGIVYEVMRLNNPTARFACKTELATLRNNLKIEWDLMTVMSEKKSKHTIIAYEMGQERNYNYIIMNLIGPSLADLRKTMASKKFTLYTTSVVAIQASDSIQELHFAGYIHRDVKPSNFAIGLLGTEAEKILYILDFGICRKLYKSGKTLRKPRARVPFRGTTQYCSPNVHLRLEPGRQDDYWSLLYMLIELHTGDLPWEKMNKDDAKKSKDSKTDELLEKCPAEFKFLRNYVRTLSYQMEPDYEKIRGILCQLMRVNDFKPDKPLDWQKNAENCKSMRKKVDEKVEKLEDLLNLPANPATKKYTDEDFPDVEGEPLHDASTSKSDDTIVEIAAPTKKVEVVKQPKEAVVVKPKEVVKPVAKVAVTSPQVGASPAGQSGQAPKGQAPKVPLKKHINLRKWFSKKK
ncbi:unnamed protein product [Caenorhabditis angaria]|uniref:Protein kinase domain-containing protein n=1 Tax=Caenorhabditis angaria TaxID=860376 RepID=A0A9P1ICI1_9PELO|nr:unnamed protein product [Caenorhabditis angaria]